jgi:hypothetical protein
MTVHKIDEQSYKHYLISIEMYPPTIRYVNKTTDYINIMLVGLPISFHMRFIIYITNLISVANKKNHIN